MQPRILAAFMSFILRCHVCTNPSFFVVFHSVPCGQTIPSLFPRLLLGKMWLLHVVFLKVIKKKEEQSVSSFSTS